MSRFSLSLTAAIATLAGAAYAQSAMDTDGDGMVTFEEVQAAMPDMTEETFLTLDANGDGALDADEIAAAQESGALPA